MKQFYPFLFLLLFAACSGQKQLVQEEPAQPSPEWVNKKPITSLYYSGIGMAVKGGSVDYLSVAKNNALNDLSSEISVKINSTSVLYQMEQNEVFREEFKSNTSLQSLENLEGFELIDTYENDREYWVYYRLSKDLYAQIKEERKNKAVNRSLDYYEKAKAFKRNWEYDDALIYTIKALESIRDYLGDPLLIELDETPTYYGNELYSFYNSTLNEISITPMYDRLQVVRGQSLSSEQLSFMIADAQQKPLSNMPVYFYYTGQRIKNKEVLSNTYGTAEYTLAKITSTNNAEHFQANLNVVAIAKEATEDPLIRKLVGQIHRT